MASSMAKSAMILSIVSSLFVLSLARIPVDLATEPDTQKEILLPGESNTTVATISPDESTELELIDPIKEFQEEEERDAHVSNLELPGEFTEHQVTVGSDSDTTSSEVIGLNPREDGEKKDEETVRKKKTKSTDESDTDSDSESDDEDEEEEDKHKKKRKKNRGKKGGFLRRFLKWINFFD